METGYVAHEKGVRFGRLSIEIPMNCMENYEMWKDKKTPKKGRKMQFAVMGILQTGKKN